MLGPVCIRKQRLSTVRRRGSTIHRDAVIPSSGACGNEPFGRYTAVRWRREVCAKSVYHLSASKGLMKNDNEAGVSALLVEPQQRWTLDLFNQEILAPEQGLLTSEAIRVTRREAVTRSALGGPSVFAGLDAATPHATEQSDGSGRLSDTHWSDTDGNNVEAINFGETARSDAAELPDEMSRLDVKQQERHPCWQGDIPQPSNGGGVQQAEFVKNE